VKYKNKWPEIEQAILRLKEKISNTEIAEIRVTKSLKNAALGGVEINGKSQKIFIPGMGLEPGIYIALASDIVRNKKGLMVESHRVHKMERREPRWNISVHEVYTYAPPPYGRMGIRVDTGVAIATPYADINELKLAYARRLAEQNKIASDMNEEYKAAYAKYTPLLEKGVETVTKTEIRSTHPLLKGGQYDTGSREIKKEFIIPAGEKAEDYIENTYGDGWDYKDHNYIKVLKELGLA